MSNSSTAVVHLQSQLRQTLRISVSDGRVFVGTFAGTDQLLNIILINTEEYRSGQGESPNGRYVGQVMVPWKLIWRVEAKILPTKDTGNGAYL
jgi:small nuclear ribonucleoprotein (snRNP)-like protein